MEKKVKVKPVSNADVTERYLRTIERKSGRAVRPYRADGFVNLMNKYGTSKDTSEHYYFQPEPTVPDDVLSMFYEGNGLFAKIIDAPAEEALKKGFTLDGISDQSILDFAYEALDELDWEEMAMTSLKWARLFGGSIAILLINDGRGLEEPLDWKSIKSIDDIRIYDRSVIQPDYSSMFSYDPTDPFGTRGSRLGMPEYYHITSRYGSFTVHDSRCLVFQNGILPENCTNSIYQLWGMPEYIRLRRAIKNTELAHESAPKMLDKSIQPIYKIKNLASILSTDDGEDAVLKRLQVIDLARGMLNSIAIDADGEDYDFKSFQFAGVSDIVDATCNYLSALTSIPQTILFGRSPAGMNSTGQSDMENYYNYVERIQKRMLRSNLRYLLSVIFQAGLYTHEVEEIPNIKIKFNSLWSSTEKEQIELEQQKAALQQTKAQTAQVYVDMGSIDPTEIRKKLADSEEFNVETILDDYSDDELFENMLQQEEQENAAEPKAPGKIFEKGDFNDYAKGNSPDAAPEATKLPQDMSEYTNHSVNADDEKWITVNGARVLLGEGGNVVKGPQNLKGKNLGSKAKKPSKNFKNEIEMYVGGGMGSIKEAFSEENISFIRENSEMTSKPLYRVEDRMFTVSKENLKPGAKFSFKDDLRSFSRGKNVIDKAIDEEIIDDMVIFKTTGKCEHFPVDKYYDNPYFSSQEESFVGGEFEVKGVSEMNGIQCYEISQVDTSDKKNENDSVENNEDGGSGSGNFGHEGREGQIGGSAPGTELAENFGKVEQRLKSVIEEYDSMFGVLLKGEATPEFMQKFESLTEERKILHKQYNDLKAQMEDLDPKSSKNIEKRYCEEGHPTRQQILDSLPTEWKQKVSSYIGEDEFYEGTCAEIFQSQVSRWSREDYKILKHDRFIDEAIKLSSNKWNKGKLYRGMSIPDEMLASLKPGETLKMKGLSSWSSDVSQAMLFAHSNPNPILIVDKTKGERNALSIAQMSCRQEEKEVIYGINQGFKIKSIVENDVEYTEHGYREPILRKRKVTVIEVEAETNE